MGYRGKLREQEAARSLRAAGKTLQQIADELDVSKSSVSIWVRDVPFTPSKRRWGPQRRPNPASKKKQLEITECDVLGRKLIGTLTDEAFLAAGVALYAGEGSKGEGKALFANTDSAMVAFFAPGFEGSSRSTSVGCEFASICTKDSTSSEPRIIGLA